ncbi:hypothetical protein EPI10_020713 [Gossypium australe]|uniref:Uncharacterized protein n=1 Tax=Gossypium australe TaxID=47621 RepID=A0A5B6WFZ2_9ROSI|nr:hypothetical protein EPI10_020713 [Gossypium australe]
MILKLLKWWGDRFKETRRGQRGQSTGQGRSNALKVNTTHIIGKPSSSVAVIGECTASGALTAEQWTLFLNFLNTCKSGTREKLNVKSNLSWIIDSGSHLEDGD